MLGFAALGLVLLSSDGGQPRRLGPGIQLRTDVELSAQSLEQLDWFWSGAEICTRRKDHHECFDATTRRWSEAPSPPAGQLELACEPESMADGNVGDPSCAMQARPSKEYVHGIFALRDVVAVVRGEAAVLRSKGKWLKGTESTVSAITQAEAQSLIRRSSGLRPTRTLLHGPPWSAELLSPDAQWLFAARTEAHGSSLWLFPVKRE